MTDIFMDVPPGLKLVWTFYVILKTEQVIVMSGVALSPFGKHTNGVDETENRMVARERYAEKKLRPNTKNEHWLQ